MTITEKNKLLANFMKVRYYPKSKDIINLLACWIKGDIPSSDAKSTNWHSLGSNKEKYHDLLFSVSWDWLMPVHYKIKTIIFGSMNARASEYPLLLDALCDMNDSIMHSASVFIHFSELVRILIILEENGYVKSNKEYTNGKSK